MEAERLCGEDQPTGVGPAVALPPPPPTLAGLSVGQTQSESLGQGLSLVQPVSPGQPGQLRGGREGRTDMGEEQTEGSRHIQSCVRTGSSGHLSERR